MNIKKILPYVGALIAAISAVVALVTILSGKSDSPEFWADVSASTEQLGSAADTAATAALANKDYVPCVVSTSVAGIAHGVAASAGACTIPGVTIDVSACLWPVEVVVVEAVASVDVAESETPVEAAPEAETAIGASETVSRVMPGTDVPAVVELSLGPIVAIVDGVLAKSDLPDTGKAWARGVLAWIDSGRASIIALVENPDTGTLAFEAVSIEGCTP